MAAIEKMTASMAGNLTIRISRFRAGLIGAAIVVCAGVAAAQVPESLTASGQSDRPISLREHAGWDRNCDGIPHPQMWLDEAPRHGTVCARTETIKIQSIYVGTQAQCIGREVSGVRLIYLPRPGYVGPDSTRYAVQYPSVRRAVSVAVTVTAGHAARQGAPEIVLPVTEMRQAPGPVPKCDDGVS